MPKSTSLLAEFVRLEVTNKVAEALRLLGEASAASQLAVQRRAELGEEASGVEFPTPAAIRGVAEAGEVLRCL